MMRKVRVGIDVDQVLRDFVGQVQHLVYEETGILVPRPTKYWYDTKKQTGISFRERIWKTGEWAKPVFEDAPVIEHAKEGYEKFLADDRFIVYIVTSQTKETTHHTLNWLEKNGFDGYEDIYITSKKLEAPCQMLIDDKISNFKDYVNNARAGVLMNATHNEEYITSRRVFDMNEAYELIENMYGS